MYVLTLCDGSGFMSVPSTVSVVVVDGPVLNKGSLRVPHVERRFGMSPTCNFASRNCNAAVNSDEKKDVARPYSLSAPVPSFCILRYRLKGSRSVHGYVAAESCFAGEAKLTFPRHAAHDALAGCKEFSSGFG